jgi:hypothetical protein
MKNLLIAVAALVPAVAFAEPKMQAGQYTVTITVEMNGRQMPPRTTSHCATREHVGDAKSFLKAMQQDKSCQIDNFKMSGSTASFDMTCTDRGQAKGHVDATFTGKGVDSTMTMSMANPKTGEQMTMKMLTHSERTGDCPAAQ